MKQFKAEHQEVYMGWKSEETRATLDHLIAQHNALCDYLAERDLQQRADLLKNATYTSDEGWHITIPKPEWWGNEVNLNYHGSYREALEAASKASGVLFTLEE